MAVHMLQQKKMKALSRLEDCGSVVVALSGGVDSAVLLALAVEALGPRRVLAATAASPSLPAGDLDEARLVSRALGARHEIVPTREIDRPDYRANRGDRCFHCRKELFEVLGRLARERGLRCVAYGAIADDLADFRPGMRAAALLGAVAPLVESGLTKPEVRQLARAAGLSVAERPAGACLASRLPVGIEVTAERLARVDRAESSLRDLGFGQLRVRHHGDVARIELDRSGLERVSDPACRARVIHAVREAGFRVVVVDPLGYRQGSLNPGHRQRREGPS